MMKCANPNCERDFDPREAKVRFCCRACKEAFANEERREALAAYRQREGTTYHQHALAAAELEVGGRFAASRPRVNCAEPIVQTPAPAPQWLRDLASLPDEPPLGYAIDDMSGDQ